MALKTCLGLTLALLAPPAAATTIAFWDFNSQPGDNNTGTGTLTPAAGFGSARLVGSVTASFTASNGSSDPNPADNTNWRITGWPAQGTGNKQHGVEFAVPTVGWRNLTLRWDLRNSNTASKYARLQYSTNGADFVDHRVIVMSAESWQNAQSASFADLPGVEDNPRFAVRFVTEFESTALGAGAAGYVTSNPGSTYGSAGTLRFDMVRFTGEPTLAAFSLLSYNVLGNGAADWSLDLPQVQALGRQLGFLQPDIIGFQEVPEAFHPQWTNFVQAYLPGHFVAVGSRTDGSERSAVASRFPIRRAQSWLARSNLSAFGYDGAFTRDLFEAEILVPGLPQPFHFFTTHLKALSDEDSAMRRAAEARAISNHFALGYLTTNAARPYALVGDLNEDIYRPRTYEQGAIQTLTSAPTGLRLTTPRNPVTNDERTWSIRNTSLTIRFDYILPGGFLFSNLVSSQVFRSDKVSPLVPPLRAADSATASDHLPVVMVLGNPYLPPVIYSARVNGSNFTLNWQSQPGQHYRVEASTNSLAGWFKAASVTVSSDTNGTWTTPATGVATFFRIVREF
jgi:endonuclease/exonuclease/phosphatase family metal-dependent hydrolase